MISISKQTSDATNGAILLKELTNKNAYKSTARVSHNKTLDGGCVLVHSGVSDCDRPILIKASIRKTDESKMQTIYENETIVTISTKHGCYSGAIQRLNMRGGIVSMNLLLKEKISS